MLEIEIFSDAICPWCFIGKRRLDTALTNDRGAIDPDIEKMIRQRDTILQPFLPLVATLGEAARLPIRDGS